MEDVYVDDCGGVPAVVIKALTGYGTVYVLCDLELRSDKREVLQRVRLEIGKSGDGLKAFAEAIAELITLSLTRGASVEQIVECLEGIRDDHPQAVRGGVNLSVPDAIAQKLSERFVQPRAENEKKAAPKSGQG